uniref:Reverse transcriptase domain-containing protein n=1 Tax=Tanacetum cinerariifolium TaxID=118510 RepID=A0A6L2NVH2_TANCI|nr:reverse transcriptase domain-containing protein [Tanacetum cinerariifolium]
MSKGPPRGNNRPLNSDPEPPPPNQKHYFPEAHKDLKVVEPKNNKSFDDEPPEVKLKELPPHLEYAFLGENNKWPVIISKDLSVNEKSALIEVLKSRKKGNRLEVSRHKGEINKIFRKKNTIPNPKGEAKAITTRSGMSYKEPPIAPPGVDQQEPVKETTDTEFPSSDDIHPPTVQVEVQVDKPTEEPSIVIPKAKANLPYPFRLQKEKLREKDNILAAKFMEIFRDLHFELSFADALIHMPKFAPMFKKLLNNKDKLIELTKMPLNENCSALADAFIAIDDEPISSNIDATYYDPEGDILNLEALLNNDLEPPPNQKDYFPSLHKDLKVVEPKNQSFKDKPPEVELKELPPHLEKLNEATRKEHFPLPFMDQILECLAGNEYYCFLDGFSGYFQIPIDPKDQEKTTFTCPYRTFTYKCMPFGLCNAPATFQRCMMAIFHDTIEQTMEVFMDDFLVFENSFSTCLTNLEKMLKRCEDTKLALNWEKSHFMVKEGIVLGHKISKKGIEVDKAKIEVISKLPTTSDDCIVLGHKISKKGIEVDKAKIKVISKLPHPTTVKGIRSFLEHAGFYRQFIKDFSKISRPITHLLEENSPFIFSNECIQAFRTLKEKLTEASILIAPNWDQPFELMFDASDYAIGAVLGQRVEKHFRPIHYASKTVTQAETSYTTTEKEMLAVVYAFEKFRSYLIMNKSIVYTDHLALKYLFAKKDAKARLLRWILLLQEFDFKVIDTKGAKNYVADHLLRLENPYENVFDPKEINETFPLKSLNKVAHQDPSTPWFADFANYHAGKFIIKGMTTQQKQKFFKDV